MVEPEAAFFELEDNMSLAERFLKRNSRDVLADCAEDMAFFAEHVEKGVVGRLEHILAQNFAGCLIQTRSRFWGSRGKNLNSLLPGAKICRPNMSDF